MQLVLAGSPLPFEATWDSNAIGRTAIKVLDYTVPSAPAVVLVPTAMRNDVGDTFVGFFTPSAGKKYLIHKAVYTDGTFAAFDTNYAQSSETIDAVDRAIDTMLGTVEDDDILTGTVED